jgi:branched-chain amino acid transport system permease protein
VLAPLLHSLVQASVSGLLLGGMLALPALGLSLVLGVQRVVNLAHGEFVVLGAYAAFVLVQASGINPLLAAPIVALVVGITAYPVERFLLRPVARFGVEAPLLATFAVSVILQNLMVIGFGADTRALDSGLGQMRIQIAGVGAPLLYLVGFGVSVGAAVAVHLVVTRTRFGRQVRAAAEDPVAAAIVGVPVREVFAATFALGGALAGLGGAMLATVFSFTPSSSVEYLLTGFAVVILGGLGSVKGALAGGVALGMAESVGAVFLGDGYRLLIGLVILLCVLAIRPQGLFGRPQ